MRTGAALFSTTILVSDTTTAEKQIQWHNESNDLKARLATATLDCQRAENDLKHESVRHMGIEGNLEREEKRNSRLIETVNRLLVPRSTETESTTPEDFNIEYMMEKQQELSRELKQIEEESQAKDALIQCLQTKREELEEEIDDINAARAGSV